MHPVLCTCAATSKQSQQLRGGGGGGGGGGGSGLSKAARAGAIAGGIVAGILGLAIVAWRWLTAHRRSGDTPPAAAPINEPIISISCGGASAGGKVPKVRRQEENADRLHEGDERNVERVDMADAATLGNTRQKHQPHGRNTDQPCRTGTADPEAAWFAADTGFNRTCTASGAPSGTLITSSAMMTPSYAQDAVRGSFVDADKSALEIDTVMDEGVRDVRILAVVAGSSASAAGTVNGMATTAGMVPRTAASGTGVIGRGSYVSNPSITAAAVTTQFPVASYRRSLEAVADCMVRPDAAPEPCVVTEFIRKLWTGRLSFGVQLQQPHTPQSQPVPQLQSEPLQRLKLQPQLLSPPPRQPQAHLQPVQSRAAVPATATTAESLAIRASAGLPPLLSTGSCDVELLQLLMGEAIKVGAKGSGVQGILERGNSGHKGDLGGGDERAGRVVFVLWIKQPRTVFQKQHLLQFAGRGNVISHHDRHNTWESVENELRLSLSFDHRNVVRALSYITCSVDEDGKPTLSVLSREKALAEPGAAGQKEGGGGGGGPLGVVPTVSTLDGADFTGAAGDFLAVMYGGCGFGADGAAGQSQTAALHCGGGVAETWVIQVVAVATRPNDTQACSAVHVQAAYMRRVVCCALDVARGLEYLHGRNVCHGDLKPGNILLTEDPSSPWGLVAKLADFGMSRSLASDRTHTTTRNFGTVAYMAPEVLGIGKVSPASCMYSFGIILWELVSGRTPYQGMLPGHIIKSVVQELEAKLLTLM
ncbi:hypothetical protein VOLCADRAFT_105557 [Volvox carteri f. nagariensis]|uniref:Protein kinase domain-containing protein n=1 Tax=Volvox carteri f. nagariensis TaxID=3068 RepID=D8U1K3_VOLCA|nr:uncharacterized protein VOLCADRAFT_105557 [Volvox carteri f. nagariensis]EFJ46355.1 hypothetical protein VOLCADRAFT_105557 [Volvox carteri f. nagariensis]|eukprot:XP_002952508.1 hypothetical protein VOLCADRAFT_105557 [Volvox carteri f. nagariensis]